MKRTKVSLQEIILKEGRSENQPIPLNFVACGVQ
jgi:hypothetical protein